MRWTTRIRLYWFRISRYEFWPFWLFYSPMFIYGFFLAVRARSLTYFTAVNRRMKYGGAFGMSKFDVLQQIPSSLIPKSIRMHKAESLPNVLSSMEEAELEFPLVAKPDIGERGKGVELIPDPEQMRRYFSSTRYAVILQEYISAPVELGVLYYRYPDGSGDGITSVVIREFLKVTGTGRKTLRALMKEEIRALFRWEYLSEKYRSRLDDVIPEGEEILLEPIGNHNRGTCFLNGNHLINDQLLGVFREIADQIEGFEYGRFDLKVDELEDIHQGLHIKILELNGVNAEPAHIYDPEYRLFMAWREIIRHMHIIFRISRINRSKGQECAPAWQMFSDLYRHLFH